MEEVSEFESNYEAQIDPNFEPQSRPRSCTWPMKRPNISGRKITSQEEDASMMLETTYEEPSIAEPSLPEDIMNFGIKPEEQHELYPTFQFMDCGNEILETSYGLDQLSDYGSMLMSPSQQASLSAETPKLSFTKLETIPQGSAFPSSSYESKPMSSSQESLKASTTKEYKGVQTSNELQNAVPSTTSGSSSTVASKPKTSSRKNAWGPLSYADLITQAIESSTDKRLTLAQIYDWFTKNIPYFKDKGESNSSAGWKNSVRHNLSLHNKFKRVQNEGTGKSSWWIINYDAKPHKPNRRRTSSLETSNSKFKHARARAVNKKNELKKQKSLPKKDQANWVQSANPADAIGDFDRSLDQVYNTADFSRPRTSSNASSLGGRMSPQRTVLTQDLEAGGPPPLSPHSYNAGKSFDFIGNQTKTDNFSRVESLDPHTKVLEGIENMDILNPTSPMTQSSNCDGTSIFLNNTPSNRQPVANVTNTNPTPNLTNLLQQGRPSHGSAPKLNYVISGESPQNKILVDVSGIVPRQRASTMPKLQPQPKYNMSNVQRKKSGDNLTQHVTGILFTSNNPATQQGTSQNSFSQYQLCQVQSVQPVQPQVQQVTRPVQKPQLVQPRQPVQQPQQVYGQQQQSDNFYNPAQQQLSMNNQQMANLSPTTPSGNFELPESKYLTDLSCIDNKDFFDPGSTIPDLDQIFQDINPPDMAGFDFSSYFPQENLNMENMDSTMEVVKVENTTQPPPYPSNPCQVTSDQPMMMQQAYTQENNVSNMRDNCNSQMMTSSNGLVFNCGPNGAVVMGDGGVCNGDVRFAQPHEILNDQNTNWSR